MIKRVFSLALVALLLIALLTACGGNSASNTGGGEGAETGGEAAGNNSGGGESGNSGGGAAAAAGGDIVGWVGSSPETIDPQLNSSSDGGTYLTHLMQGLYRYKWDGSGVELGDAESVEISADNLTWTFKLRGDIKWSDGQPVTAHDYEYAWKRLCDPATAAPYAEDMGAFILNGLEVSEGAKPVDELGVKALDERTLEVSLSGPCAFFDQVVVFATFEPVRQDMIEKAGDGWWHDPATFMSNGPFKMKEFSLDEKLVLVPNDQYYDKDKVVPTSVTWLFLADEDSALSAFRSNEVDICNQVPLPEIDTMKAEGVFALRDLLGTYYLDFNLEKAIFQDVNVRKALTLAIDRQYICDTLNFGTRVPATSYVGFGFADVEQTQDFRQTGGIYIGENYEENKRLAAEAMAAAGYEGGAGFPVLEYMYNTSSGHKTIAEAIAHDWETVLGIRVNLVNQDWGVFLDTRRKGDYEIARDGWLADFNDASSMLNLNISGSGNNNAKYNSAAFDKLMYEAAQAGDRATHINKMHEAEKVMMEDWAVCPIFFYKQNYIASSSLNNWHETPLGYTLLHLASK
jgi:oligopeptide transport system substrate-binding protein